MKLAKGLLVGFASLLGLQGPAIAQSDDHVTYVVRQGDTLHDLAREYFISQRVVPALMRLNRISDPRRLQIGSRLRIPRPLLRYEPEPLRILAFSGPVSLSRSGAAVAPRVGEQVLEGSLVRTGAKGFISFGGAGNSRLSLPSNSLVQIREAKRYLINDAIDFDVRVLEGRTETRAPKLKDEERYRVGTPMAVTAVRGTEFRVAYDDRTELSLTEVTEGTVVVSAGAADAVATAGAGIASVADTLGRPEQLLPAPEVIEAGRIQTGENVAFAIARLDRARAYRTQIARDAGFIELVAEEIDTDAEVAFEGIEDGRFFVRSRAIAESGLEGLADTYAFRRKRLGISASVEPSPFEDFYKFAWLPEGEGESFAAFQLWNAEDTASMIVDEVGLQNGGFYVGPLAPGKYIWRVATFQIDEGDVIKVWSPEQEFAVTE